eukprot:m.90566 g.90566  ORF g.90566 m.90566 type:complete len:85 (-) comp20134_c0_seq2:1133-1387(-)
MVVLQYGNQATPKMTLFTPNCPPTLATSGAVWRSSVAMLTGSAMPELIEHRSESQRTGIIIAYHLVSCVNGLPWQVYTVHTECH